MPGDISEPDMPSGICRTAAVSANIRLPYAMRLPNLILASTHSTVMPKQDHDSVKMYRIRKMLEEISQKSGRGTELITVYIPYNRQLHEVIGTLQDEQGTATNIKSDLTRNHVVSSLGKVVQRLKMYKKTPKRGLVVFCGALPPEEGGPLGSETLKIYEIDPPKELKQYLYRCDDHFHVDILKDMLRDEAAIGFLAIDSKEAGWVCCVVTSWRRFHARDPELRANTDRAASPQSGSKSFAKWR